MCEFAQTFGPHFDTSTYMDSSVFATVKTAITNVALIYSASVWAVICPEPTWLSRVPKGANQALGFYSHVESMHLFWSIPLFAMFTIATLWLFNHLFKQY